MNKKILTTLFLIISIASFVHAEDEEEILIDCNIGKVNYIFFNQLMSCTVSGKPNIVSKKTKVTGICGGSTAGIKVFYALSKVIKYIPKNLDQVFKDLTGFRLENTQLKMVTKEDLEPFPELLMFASVSNQIEFLEEDLFKFNVKLQYVSFRANKITYIHPNVFTVISGTLKQLYMDAQAINCGIGNPTTATAIEDALFKFSSSQCADILNAPALYTLWLELKAQLSGGGGGGGSSAELETCNTELTTCQDELTSKQTELEGLQGTFQEITLNHGKCCGGDTSIDVCPGS